MISNLTVKKGVFNNKIRLERIGQQSELVIYLNCSKEPKRVSVRFRGNRGLTPNVSLTSLIILACPVITLKQGIVRLIWYCSESHDIDIL